MKDSGGSNIDDEELEFTKNNAQTEETINSTLMKEVGCQYDVEKGGSHNEMEREGHRQAYVEHGGSFHVNKIILDCEEIKAVHQSQDMTQEEVHIRSTTNVEVNLLQDVTEDFRIKMFK